MSWPVVLAYPETVPAQQNHNTREKPLVQSLGKTTVAKWQTGGHLKAYDKKLRCPDKMSGYP